MFPTSKELASTLLQDGEFMLAARYWNGGFTLSTGKQRVEIKVEDGVPSAGKPEEGDIVEFEGPGELWEGLLAPVPPRYFHDIAVVMSLGMELKTDRLSFSQYYPAVMRAVELMRPANPDKVVTIPPVDRHGAHDQAVGRYVHVTHEGEDYRIYYEEAGQGIPVLVQHTAGAHGAQWRHVLEDRELTQHFRFIAYDLPFHGKSIPPSGRQWWAEPYLLRSDFLRGFVLKLSSALGLDKPVFMGCSVGGVLALDLACRHPEHFRAVVSVEGALKVDADPNDFNAKAFYHPQVSNEYKGRLMHALTAPTAPEAYRRETIQTYMAGWPPAFIGDLNYYALEFDVRDLAGAVDTSQIGVHIMNGEYDVSGSWELGEAAHQSIKGSTWTKMEGIGHFPMCEDPERFLGYVRPVFEKIRAGA